MVELQIKPLMIPAILPPRTSLNPETRKGLVDITIRNEGSKARTYYGKITYYDENRGEVEFFIGNGHGLYAYIRQENGMSEAWFDMSDTAFKRETTLDKDHPVFADILRSVAIFPLEEGFRHEQQAYANLGPVDFWGFLRGKSAGEGYSTVAVDKAA